MIISRNFRHRQGKSKRARLAPSHCTSISWSRVSSSSRTRWETGRYFTRLALQLSGLDRSRVPLSARGAGWGNGYVHWVSPTQSLGQTTHGGTPSKHVPNALECPKSTATQLPAMRRLPREGPMGNRYRRTWLKRCANSRSTACNSFEGLSCLASSSSR
jgi:hypothetical protein